MHHQHICGQEDQSDSWNIIYNTTIDGTRECGSEFGGRINLFPLQHINEFPVPYNQIGPVSKIICESFDGSPEGLPT
jgi:hypothetical protein